MENHTVEISTVKIKNYYLNSLGTENHYLHTPLSHFLHWGSSMFCPPVYCSHSLFPTKLSQYKCKHHLEAVARTPNKFPLLSRDWSNHHELNFNTKISLIKNLYVFFLLCKQIVPHCTLQPRHPEHSSMSLRHLHFSTVDWLESSHRMEPSNQMSKV
jgi:hypothetical protein